MFSWKFGILSLKQLNRFRSAFKNKLSRLRPSMSNSKRLSQTSRALSGYLYEGFILLPITTVSGAFPHKTINSGDVLRGVRGVCAHVYATATPAAKLRHSSCAAIVQMLPASTDGVFFQCRQSTCLRG